MNPQEDKSKEKPVSKPVNALIKGDRYMSIAFILPVSIVIGYGIGWWVDKKFGTTYWALVGLLVGIVGGFVDMIRQIRAK
jgi:F0F1-type ATP synthase assembly protein I